MYQINYEKTRRYFFPRKYGKAILGTLLICLISIMLVKNSSNWVIPVLIALISAGIAIYLIKETLDNDNYSDVSDEIKKVRECILDEALNELGIDQEQCNKIPPVIMDNKYFGQCFESFAYREDTNIPSEWQVVVLLFSEEQVYYFQYIFSLISDANLKNSAEYFYKDIVGFNMNSVKENVTYKENGTEIVKNISYQSFSLRTSGGDAFSICINDADKNKIQGMRNLLREKKATTI